MREIFTSEFVTYNCVVLVYILFWMHGFVYIICNIFLFREYTKMWVFVLWFLALSLLKVCWLYSLIYSLDDILQPTCSRHHNNWTHVPKIDNYKTNQMSSTTYVKAQLFTKPCLLLGFTWSRNVPWSVVSRGEKKLIDL